MDITEIEFNINNTISTGKSPMEFLTGLNAKSDFEAALSSLPHAKADSWSLEGLFIEYTHAKPSPAKTYKSFTYH
jgi:hypothetical protein